MIPQQEKVGRVPIGAFKFTASQTTKNQNFKKHSINKKDIVKINVKRESFLELFKKPTFNLVFQIVLC